MYFILLIKLTLYVLSTHTCDDDGDDDIDDENDADDEMMMPMMMPMMIPMMILIDVDMRHDDYPQEVHVDET